MKEKILTASKIALSELGIGEIFFDISHNDFAKGDYSSNLALMAGKLAGQDPQALAAKIKEKLDGKIQGIEKIEVAGAGFLNFFLSEGYIVENLKHATSFKYGINELYSGKKIMVEYTDPNPFKEFHIGHLMSNTVGESLSRLVENGNAKTIRANYQGDMGLQIGKAIFGMLELKGDKPADSASIREKVDFLGRAYVLGSQKYEEDEKMAAKIKDLNLAVFEESDLQVNEFYKWGRDVSLEAFEVLYEKLGTKFNRYYFESDMALAAIKLVKDNLGKVFQESDGAIIFKGEEYGLHTRVFINSQDLPTYEAKELALSKQKFEDEGPDVSVVITANEQKNYFEVVMKSLSLLYPDISDRTKHISHGMMRLPSGKMSSRKGNIVTAESLITGVENIVAEKMADRDIPKEEKEKIISDVAVGAIKYSILKQSIGKDIQFDFDKSISFEGDSGPYMQYTAVRIKSLLGKAKSENLEADISNPENSSILERMIYRFPEIVERAAAEMAPQYIATYLIELCAAYNSYYANHLVIGDENASYRLYVSRAVLNVLSRGLWLLGIKVPEKM